MLSQLKCQGLRICIRCIRTVVPSSSSLRGTLLFLRHHAQMTHMNIQTCTLYSHRTLHTSLHTVTSLIPNHSTTHGTCGLQSGSRCERTGGGPPGRERILVQVGQGGAACAPATLSDRITLVQKRTADFLESTGTSRFTTSRRPSISVASSWR